MGPLGNQRGLFYQKCNILRFTETLLQKLILDSLHLFIQRKDYPAKQRLHKVKKKWRHIDIC